MPATIFSGSKVKALKQNFSLNDVIEFMSGTVDPQSTATSAPAGSMYTNTDTGQIYRKLDAGSTTNWVKIGSGGVDNYIVNPDAEGSVNNWFGYDDGAAAPVDGKDGTVTSTWTRTTSSPLKGAGSFLFTPIATLGEGYYANWTLNREDLARVLSVSFSYEINTYTSFTDGDISVFIISASDSGFTTNLQVLQTAPYKILKASGVEQFKSTFQTHATNLYYKLCFHQVTAATGYTLKIDNIVVGPQAVIQGTPVTDPIQYSMTVTGSTSNPTISSQNVSWWRSGKYMNVEGRISFNASGSGFYTFNLPSGYTIDYTQPGINQSASLSDTSGAVQTIGSVFGSAYLSESNFGSMHMPVVSSSQNQTGVCFIYTIQNTNTDLDFSRANVIGAGEFASGWFYKFKFQVPILGWSSSTLMSSDTETRVVAARYRNAVATSITDTSEVTIPFATKSFDTHDAWDGTSLYTVRVQGTYWVNVITSFNNATSAAPTFNDYANLRLYKNGSIYANLATLQTYATSGAGVYPVLQGSSSVDCVAGDTLQIKILNNLGYNITANADTTGNYIDIHRLAGPAQIAASEKITASYYGSGASLANITSGTQVTVSSTYLTWSKYIDTRGIFSISTGIATIPVSGDWEIFISAQMNQTLWTAGASNDVFVGVSIDGGTTIVLNDYRPYTNQPYVTVNGFKTLRINAGSTVALKVFQQSGSNISIYPSEVSYFSIKKI